jgi:hypothetical protein
MSEAKYRAYILELSGTVRCLGTFDSEELAQTALDRAQFYRARNNLLLVSVVDVLERACGSEMRDELSAANEGVSLP